MRAGSARHKAFRLGAALALALLSALPARADLGTLERPGMRADMGRIAHSGFRSFAHCTASVLKGGHVVTAAHCLPEPVSGEIHFGLGYDRGDAVEIISARGTDYLVPAGRDIALFCGGAAELELEVGLEVGAPDAPPEEVSFWGYGRPFVHILNRKRCAVTRSSARYLMLDCAATPGTSGGPVTVGEPPQLVGIVSRASRTTTVVERFSAADLDAACAGLERPGD